MIAKLKDFGLSYRLRQTTLTSSASVLNLIGCVAKIKQRQDAFF